jgi:protein-S-isoprenylcysteine O-methyltransferase Ste14
MIVMIIIAVLVFISLLKITAGYGQHISKKWGPTIKDKVGWVIMENPTLILYALFYIIGDYQTKFLTLLFSGLWFMHYGYRTFIFPSLIRGRRQMPVTIILFGMIFNSANAYLQGRWINKLSGGYESSWLLTPMFIVGITIFFTGFFMHIHSDHIIRNLRKPGETDFKIPYGGMFQFISCPSYLGEIIEWYGWAIMTWSLPGLVFAIWTTANLGPRARSNHHWYQETFKDYPKNRKALIPFIF